MIRPRVLLASASPRRRELLNLVGIGHEVRPANIDETYLPGELPRAHAERLAREKALAIDAPDAVTIGSDTIVVVDGEVLGKPRDRAHAAEMLRQLSGRSHIVMTGVATRWRGELASGLEEVGVTFCQLSDEEIEQGKGQLKGQITLSLESPTARMYRAAAVDLYGEPYRTLDEMLQLVDRIRSDTIQELAQEFLAPEQQTVLSLGPPAPAAKSKTRRRG